MAETKQAIADRHGITRQWLAQLEKRGLDIYDDAAVKAALSDGGASSDSQRLTKARADKEEHLARRARVAADLEEGKTVTSESQLQDGMKAGLLIQQAFMKLPTELPPLLAGLSSAEMSKQLDIYAHDRLHELCIAFDDLGTPVASGAKPGGETPKKAATKRVGRGKRSPAE